MIENHEAALSGIHMDAVTLEQMLVHGRRNGDPAEDLARYELKMASLRESERVLRADAAARAAAA